MGEIRQQGVSHFDKHNKPFPPDHPEYGTDNDYRLKEIKITTKSGGEVFLDKIFTGASIYEDIFSNTMSASISFNDTNNLVKNLPIIGQQEELEITFKCPGAEDITYKFEIYKVNVRQISTVGKKQAITLKAVSKEQFKNIHTKISESYFDTIDNIIKKICDCHLGISGDPKLEIKVKTDSEKRKFIIPNWRPFDAVNWLKRRATPEDNSEAVHYVFYQDREGYKFDTIENLIKEQEIPKMEYFYMPRRFRENPGWFRDPGYEWRNVQRLVVENPGDRMIENIEGMYGRKILTHDIVKKKYEFTEFKLKDDWDSTKHVEKEYPICKGLDEFSDKTDTYFTYYPIHNKLNMENDRGGETVCENEKYDEWLLKRTSLMKQLDSMIININVSGDSRRKCGDVIDLKVTPMEPGTKDDKKLDKYISGKCLITSIKHNITPDGYWMDIELSKDSVQEQYPTSSNFMGSQEGSPTSCMG